MEFVGKLRNLFMKLHASSYLNTSPLSGCLGLANQRLVAYDSRNHQVLSGGKIGCSVVKLIYSYALSASNLLYRGLLIPEEPAHSQASTSLMVYGHFTIFCPNDHQPEHFKASGNLNLLPGLVIEINTNIQTSSRARSRQYSPPQSPASQAS